jgi:hypothetical protein
MVHEHPLNDGACPVDDQGRPVDDQGRPVDNHSRPVDNKGCPANKKAVPSMGLSYSDTMEAMFVRWMEMHVCRTFRMPRATSV